MGNLILRLRKAGARLGQGWGKVLGKVRARSGQGPGKVWTKSKVRARSGQARSGQGWGKVEARLGQASCDPMYFTLITPPSLSPASITNQSLYHYLHSPCSKRYVTTRIWYLGVCELFQKAVVGKFCSLLMASQLHFLIKIVTVRILQLLYKY